MKNYSHNNNCTYMLFNYIHSCVRIFIKIQIMSFRKTFQNLRIVLEMRLLQGV